MLSIDSRIRTVHSVIYRHITSADFSLRSAIA